MQEVKSAHRSQACGYSAVADAVDYVRSRPGNMAASITPQHILLSRNELFKVCTQGSRCRQYPQHLRLLHSIGGKTQLWSERQGPPGTADCKAATGDAVKSQGRALASTPVPGRFETSSAEAMRPWIMDRPSKIGGRLIVQAALSDGSAIAGGRLGCAGGPEAACVVPAGAEERAPPPGGGRGGHQRGRSLLPRHGQRPPPARRKGFPAPAPASLFAL